MGVVQQAVADRIGYGGLPDDLMPPARSHKKPLDTEAVKTLTEWIRQGAEWGDHWAFVVPKKSALPEGVHPVDHFVGRQLARC